MVEEQKFYINKTCRNNNFVQFTKFTHTHISCWYDISFVDNETFSDKNEIFKEFSTTGRIQSRNLATKNLSAQPKEVALFWFHPSLESVSQYFIIPTKSRIFFSIANASKIWRPRQSHQYSPKTNWTHHRFGVAIGQSNYWLAARDGFIIPSTSRLDIEERRQPQGVVVVVVKSSLGGGGGHIVVWGQQQRIEVAAAAAASFTLWAKQKKLMGKKDGKEGTSPAGSFILSFFALKANCRRLSQCLENRSEVILSQPAAGALLIIFTFGIWGVYAWICMFWAKKGFLS